MDNVSALLRLFCRMSANLHQRFNDPFKGVHLIVPGR
jgi:hypothetical protein